MKNSIKLLVETTIFSGGTAQNPPTVSHIGGTQTNICATLATTEEIFNKNSFFVYPNPFTDVVTIDLGEYKASISAKIVDIAGKSLLSFELNSENNKIDLSSLESRIYFCQLASNTKTETAKIIKK